MRSQLRDYQHHAINQLKSSIAGGKRRPLLKLSTGSGKTKIAAAIVDGALKKGNKVVFTVPAISLIDQTVQSFLDEGITDIGVIQAQHKMTNPNMPVQIASVQSLEKRFKPDADVIVVDEAHRFFKFYGEWMADPAFAKVPFIGLSATPWTKGLGKHFDDLIIGTSTQQLIDAGYLSRFEVFAPSHPDLTGVKTVAGDYHEGELSEAMQAGTLVADIVETWLKMGRNEPTLCFGVDRNHAKAIKKAFDEAGVGCGYVDARTPMHERKEVQDKFHSGEYKVVSNVGVLTTGVDWDVRCLILARPTKSIMLFEQIIGRALRTAPGKEIARILDHSDTHLRLGLVTDINRTELCTGAPRSSSGSANEDGPPLPKECPSCSFLKPPKVAECPHCGFKPEGGTEIEMVDGDLVSFTGKAGTAGKKYVPTPSEKLDFFKQLKGYALKFGKADKWVMANYRAKFGEWPHKKRGVEPIPPKAEVYNWVKHQRIKWAKSRKAA